MISVKSARFDAAGIGALVSLQAAGVYLKLLNPTQPVREILRLKGLEAVFEIGDGRSAEELLTPSTVAVGQQPEVGAAIPR